MKLLAIRLKYAGTTGHNAGKRHNPILNETYGHPNRTLYQANTKFKN